MVNFGEVNFSGGIGRGVNPEDFKVVENVEKTKDAYTPKDKKTNLSIATKSAEIAKEQGLKLNSLERGAGFAS